MVGAKDGQFVGALLQVIALEIEYGVETCKSNQWKRARRQLVGQHPARIQSLAAFEKRPAGIETPSRLGEKSC